jgi:nitroreductase
MEFFEAVGVRRSTRAFLPRAVPEEALRRILETANLAPSAGNLQSYEIFAVTNKRKREDLARAAREQIFIAGAPVVLVFAKHPALSEERYGARAESLYSIQDATIACAFASLAAAAQGLGSCWIGAFDAEEVRKIVGAPRGVTPVSMLPIGYASERPKDRERRALEELVRRVE